MVAKRDFINAKIGKASLHLMSGVVPTIVIDLNMGGSYIGHGTYDLRRGNRLESYLMQLFRVAGVESFDALVGKYVRFERSTDTLMHVLDDDITFCPKTDIDWEAE